MKHGLSLGYSTASEMSHSENGWKEKAPKIALFLLLAVLLALFFGYLTHSVSPKISPSSPTEAVASD